MAWRTDGPGICLPSVPSFFPRPPSFARLEHASPFPPLVATYGQMTSALFTLQLFSFNLGSFLF